MRDIQFQQKLQEYHTATKHILNKRIELKNLYVPKIVIKDGVWECIYPDKYLKLDKELESCQNLIWDAIFKDDNPWQAKNEINISGGTAMTDSEFCIRRLPKKEVMRL